MSLDVTAALEVTAPAAPLAEAAARIARLLPARTLRPELAGVLLRVDGQSLVLAGTDGDVAAQVSVPATVHTGGEVVVSRRGLAATLTAMDAVEVRLVVEGSRLALRTPAARFALPQLDVAAHPRVPELPPVSGRVTGAVLRSSAIPVASAASREHALPIFTGVRVRSSGDRLLLMATDRFRMAYGRVPWQPADAGHTVDALVPAALLSEVARQAGRAETVEVHCDGDRFGLAWAGGSVVMATLGNPFPDEQIDRLLETVTECAVEVEADSLIAAVERALPYAGPGGRTTVEAADGVLVVRGTGSPAGESEETLKASVRGDRLTRHYQARYLLDALRPFTGGTVLVEMQEGLRATALRAGGAEGAILLRYLIVPMRAEEGPSR